jgi:hypothetical protein
MGERDIRDWPWAGRGIAMRNMVKMMGTGVRYSIALVIVLIS